MKTTITSVFAAAMLLASTTQAHMVITYPPPYRAKNNPNADPNTIDYSMTSPLSGASQFPCKDYQSDFGTPAGASVATWAAGSTTNFTVGGSAVHGGGSCQTSLSYDKGKTFTVMTSFQGSCPLSDGEDFPFTVPSDAPAGDAIFAWTWYNKIGNREIYMNCATVTITGASSKAKRADTAFSARPQIFQANLGNGCSTVEGKEVVFPNPGPDVVDKQTGDNSGSLTGCSAGSGSGDTSPSSAGASSPSSAASSEAASPTPSGGVFLEPPSSSSAISTPDATTAPVAASPTTMLTLVSPSASASSPATEVAPSPVGTPTAAPDPVISPSPSASGGTTTTTGAETGACSPEGLWNCIGGTSFQQCASGSWSVVMQVAAGTKCTPGQSAAIDISAS